MKKSRVFIHVYTNRIMQKKRLLTITFKRIKFLQINLKTLQKKRPKQLGKYSTFFFFF